MDLRSNGNMVEDGSEYDQNGGKIEENRDFRRFSQILWLESYRSIL